MPHAEHSLRCNQINRIDMKQNDIKSESMRRNGRNGICRKDAGRGYLSFIFEGPPPTRAYRRCIHLADFFSSDSARIFGTPVSDIRIGYWLDNRYPLFTKESLTMGT